MIPGRLCVLTKLTAATHDFIGQKVKVKPRVSLEFFVFNIPFNISNSCKDDDDLREPRFRVWVSQEALQREVVRRSNGD